MIKISRNSETTPPMSTRYSQTRYSQTRAKLVDSQDHGPGSNTELILVEGDSAASSVVAVRDPRRQAVLPLQGKPLNAWTASEAKVAQHVLFQQLAQALGLAAPTAWLAGQPEALRFNRVVLLFDPDADGIHIGALMVLYFQRWLPGLISGGYLWLARAPMFEIEVPADLHKLALESNADAARYQYAYNPVHCRQLVEHLKAQSGSPDIRVRAFRGLGGLAPALLRERCVNPATRVAHALSAADVQGVVEVFGGAG
jgi:DNA gyrase subunit B